MCNVMVVNNMKNFAFYLILITAVVWAIVDMVLIILGQPPISQSFTFLYKVDPEILICSGYLLGHWTGSRIYTKPTLE